MKNDAFYTCTTRVLILKEPSYQLLCNNPCFFLSCRFLGHRAATVIDSDYSMMTARSLYMYRSHLGLGMKLFMKLSNQLLQVSKRKLETYF